MKPCVKINGNLIDFFCIPIWELNKEKTSHFFYLYDLSMIYMTILRIMPSKFDTFSIDDLHIFLLLFADDTVLFSHSKEGLQNL